MKAPLATDRSRCTSPCPFGPPRRDHAQSITVTLDPTGNRNELEAIEELFDVVNGWKLTLPGDAKKRPLRFRSHLL